MFPAVIALYMKYHKKLSSLHEIWNIFILLTKYLAVLTKFGYLRTLFVSYSVHFYF